MLVKPGEALEHHERRRRKVDLATRWGSKGRARGQPAVLQDLPTVDLDVVLVHDRSKKPCIEASWRPFRGDPSTQRDRAAIDGKPQTALFDHLPHGAALGGGQLIIAITVHAVAGIDSTAKGNTHAPP